MSYHVKDSQITQSIQINKVIGEPWLVRLSGFSTGLGNKGSPVQFPVRAHAWVSGQVPGRECER